MTEARPGQKLAELARTLWDGDTGGWRRTDLRALVEERLGWEWSEAEGGPTVSRPGTGADGSRTVGWLRPVDRFEKDYAHDGEEYVGIYLPLGPDPLGEDPLAPARQAPTYPGPLAGPPEPAPAVGRSATATKRPGACPVPAGALAATPAHAFRQAGDALTEALGPASLMGSYGMPMPYYDSPPLWGSPFLRWRGQRNCLELHPGPNGPQLLLLPTDPQENWHLRQGHGEPGALGGFFGVRTGDPATAGLGIPGGWRADDWGVFERALGEFLSTLAAETRALGIAISMSLHGDVPGMGGPMLCNLSSADTLEIGHYTWTSEQLANGPRADTMRALGWIPTEEVPATHEHWDPVNFTTGAFGPGEADGAALARTVVGYLREVGVPHPASLTLSDNAQQISGYWVTYYGLTLREAD
ncbi:hypothetical protein E0L36_19520 [Streptomyces sp. AJS327]|uniref:TY-Chap domain-containing protein n=1 Tax=Streptomyces sp. AJS327 TaxID=2545265 RepID=UPI0015DE5A62|nr:hypothetical protein [Streptomyces sp. AJS327]MBA0052984.1 hypothetical protein [Streptomyces sp. AJS327]